MQSCFAHSVRRPLGLFEIFARRKVAREHWLLDEFLGIIGPELAFELRDGQSFAIAGLLQTKNTRAISQVPWIGSVPVLGALFRSADYQQQETDLVVIVTPHLVGPAVPGQRLASPLDSRLPSNDVDFFLNGQPEVRKRYTDFVTSGADLVGPYGHIIAPDDAGRPVAAGAIVKAKD